MDKSASTIGYIDLASWRSFIANPQVNKGILAVIYSGLDTIAAPEVLKHRHQAFRGIAIDQRSGKVALATMWRGQITELSPLPAFWR